MENANSVITVIYQAMAVVSIVVTGGFAYISLYVRAKMADLRLQIIEDVRQEFAPVKELEDLKKKVELLVANHDRCNLYNKIIEERANK